MATYPLFIGRECEGPREHIGKRTLFIRGDFDNVTAVAKAIVEHRPEILYFGAGNVRKVTPAMLAFIQGLKETPDCIIRVELDSQTARLVHQLPAHVIPIVTFACQHLPFESGLGFGALAGIMLFAPQPVVAVKFITDSELLWFQSKERLMFMTHLSHPFYQEDKEIA